MDPAGANSSGSRVVYARPLHFSHDIHILMSESIFLPDRTRSDGEVLLCAALVPRIENPMEVPLCLAQPSTGSPSKKPAGAAKLIPSTSSALTNWLPWTNL